jgi:hypothetical protein
LGTGGAVVKTDGTATDISAVEVTHGLTSLINRGELNVSKALRASRLGVGRQTDSENGTLLLESLTDNILVGVEGKVSDEQGRALGAGLVTVRASTRLSFVTGSALLRSVTGFGVVEVDGTAVNLRVFLGFVGSLGAGSLDVLDVTESRNLSKLAGLNESAVFSLTLGSDQSRAQS